MSDNKKEKLAPPSWLGRPILDHGHVMDLETRAAMNEFGHKMPRHEAEQKAHDDYVQEQRERAAAHHLAGLKAAGATGNHEDARKHWALYDMHLKALGKESIGAVPPEIEKRMMEETGQKPIYKFKAHKGDLYALHEPSKDQAPPQGQPIQKAEVAKLPWKDQRPVSQDKLKPENHMFCQSADEGICGICGMKTDGHKGPAKVLPFEKDELAPFEKREVGQCKWKLGERRCKRMVTTDYCHDHVGHWANKIQQKAEREETAEIAKSLLKSIADLAKEKLPK
jgi:hypothetical protein